MNLNGKKGQNDPLIREVKNEIQLMFDKISDNNTVQYTANMGVNA